MGVGVTRETGNLPRTTFDFSMSMIFIRHCMELGGKPVGVAFLHRPTDIESVVLNLALVCITSG